MINYNSSIMAYVLLEIFFGQFDGEKQHRRQTVKTPQWRCKIQFEVFFFFFYFTPMKPNKLIIIGVAQITGSSATQGEAYCLSQAKYSSGLFIGGSRRHWIGICDRSQLVSDQEGPVQNISSQCDRYLNQIMNGIQTCTSTSWISKWLFTVCTEILFGRFYITIVFRTTW